jgi:hypothetical protein
MNKLFVASAALLLSTMALSAGTLSYGPLAEGAYYGSGNTNAGFNIDTAGQLELGLSAIIRYTGPEPAPQEPSDLDAYYVPPGESTYVKPGHTTPVGGSTWDFVYSVDTGSDSVSAYTYQITITDLTNNSISPSSFDPSNPSIIPDNATTGGVNGFQNAEALSFGFLPGYDVNAGDTYQITLAATPVTGGQTESVSIDVNVTPEPTTWLLFGTGLLGLLFVRRHSFSR